MMDQDFKSAIAEFKNYLSRCKRFHERYTRNQDLLNPENYWWHGGALYAFKDVLKTIEEYFENKETDNE